ncbi:thiamine pyrophosphate-dependent dehydrogenase E1 component subunit alpha [Paenibacillus psychroresistens]|uniref:Thiamine pyrophosphate-dependent dehydrogenase E1 component subunit alpha n=1 Tax=Paenibacillus psychroresistens TaxID=1778678 RepID=A0A6B8RFM2_9BACL|nr:thiamine pyrophosphate-dependent dehydrogenase E1 component subunit alpha [Paenibacillus psychroresistens]QGQ94292.1 thiamine pyrophosphate-dependent dehydrogenase E1 component subunit alpha [Paenibacillus psychroresistens]
MAHTLPDFYKKMQQIRLFEEQAIELYKEGLVGGSYHSYIGQEAIATGVCTALRAVDYITTTYRGRGQHLAKGADPQKLFAEILGKIDGYCKGKGGPMHIAAPEIGILGANGIVGAGVPIAAGGALSAKMNGLDRISVAFFGDGAMNQGVIYEAMNLAALWDLPMLFVCENNEYSEMTPIRDSVKVLDFIGRAASLGIQGVTVDGNDAEAVYAETLKAMERASKGEGPTFMEAKTYRLQGHMYGDSEIYRSKDEVQAWKEKDPIKRAKEKLLQQGQATESQIEQWISDIKAELNTAVEAARISSEPSYDEIYTDVV